LRVKLPGVISEGDRVQHLGLDANILGSVNTDKNTLKRCWTHSFRHETNWEPALSNV